MVKKGGEQGPARRKPYRGFMQIPGIHQQSWAPDESYYHIFRNAGETNQFLFTLAGDMGPSGQTAEVRTMNDGTQVEASVTVVNTLGDFSHMLSSDRGICVKVNGVYYAIHPDAGDVGSTPTTIATFTLDAELAVGVAQTASATIVSSSDIGTYPDGSTITVTSYGQWRGQAGAAGLAARAGDAWWVVYLEQRPARVLGDLTGGLAVTDASQTLQNPVALDAWPNHDLPDPLTAHNPHKFHCVAGDKAIAKWNESQERYEIEEILPAFAERFWFRLKANQSWPLGRQQTAGDTIVEGTHVAAGYSGALPTGASLSIVDRYDLAHNANGSVSTSPSDTGLAEYDPEADEYVVMEITHRATHCLGTLDGAFSGTPATFSVSIAQDGCLDGAHPGFIETGSATISVQNRYSWRSGKDGDEIEIIRDPHTGDWYPAEGDVSDALFQYKLTADWNSNNRAIADILTPRQGILLFEEQFVYDPKELMTDQLVGDSGYCQLTSEGYVAIQAPCTGFDSGGNGGFLPPIAPDPFVPTGV